VKHSCVKNVVKTVMTANDLFSVTVSITLMNAPTAVICIMDPNALAQADKKRNSHAEGS